MPADEEHVAHPRLYGAPAYARPPLSITQTTLPPDPDDLPIAAEQTPLERAVIAQLHGAAFGPNEVEMAVKPEPRRRPQPLGLSTLAGRFLGRASWSLGRTSQPPDRAS